MKKKIKIDTVFHDINFTEPIKVTKEILEKIQMGDTILSGLDEGYYSENESWDPRWEFTIRRERLETDDEFQKRVESDKQQEVWNTERRYKSYLKLKKEFDGLD